MRSWAWYLVVALVCEKIVQHIFVTGAFYVNWSNIRATVAGNPDVLMILGAIVAVLFVFALVGMLRYAAWAIALVAALSAFDMIGEFIAQGTIGIVINVSFIVATVLLCLTFLYSRQKLRST